MKNKITLFFSTLGLLFNSVAYGQTSSEKWSIETSPFNIFTLGAHEIHWGVGKTDPQNQSQWMLFTTLDHVPEDQFQVNPAFMSTTGISYRIDLPPIGKSNRRLLKKTKVFAGPILIYHYHKEQNRKKELITSQKLITGVEVGFRYSLENFKILFGKNYYFAPSVKIGAILHKEGESQSEDPKTPRILRPFNSIPVFYELDFLRIGYNF